jgi:hypothetical protein
MPFFKLWQCFYELLRSVDFTVVEVWHHDANTYSLVFVKYVTT